MKKQEISFLSCDGKTKINAVKWIPDSGEYHAILQITHGMVEYIDRYEPFAEYLTQHGFLVVGHDHLGHGKSVTSQEEWGFFREKDPSDAVIADMHQLRGIIQGENGDIPYFMLGHSMGSFMLRKYLTFYQEDLTGAIIMGTGFIPGITTAMAKLLTKCMAVFRGWHFRSKLISGLAFGKSYKRYDLSGKNLSNSWLTKDVSVVKKYYGLPECTFTFTLNGYLGLFEAVSEACSPAKADRIPKNLPLLLVSGEDDPVGDFGAGVRKSCELYKNAGIKDVTCKLYKEDRHEILNELDRSKVYEDIRKWMEARCRG